MTLRLECQDCDGDGHLDYKTCQTCNGTGDAPDGTPDPYCEACRGDGRLYGEPCQSCDGTGFKRRAAVTYS